MAHTDLSSTSSNWFAIQAWAGREHFCAAHLQARGYEIFLPCFRQRRRRSDRISTVTRALFTGYMFCRIQGEVFANIVTTPGVIRIVGDGSRPLAVPTDEIEALQSVVASGLAYEPTEFLTAGQSVRVIAGPLCDYEGIVLRTPTEHRLLISVTLLRRSVAVEIHPTSVCPIAAPTCYAHRRDR